MVITTDIFFGQVKKGIDEFLFHYYQIHTLKLVEGSEI